MKIMQLILLSIVFIFGSQKAQAEEYLFNSNLYTDYGFCVVDEGSGIYNKATLAMKCSTKRELASLLETIEWAAYPISAACLYLPDPTISKVVAGIGFAGGFALKTISFIVRRSECEEDRPLSRYQLREISYKMCQTVGRDYNEHTGKCDP